MRASAPQLHPVAAHAMVAVEVRRGAFLVAVALCFTFGLSARIWIFTGGLGQVNADEALVGPMTLRR